MISKKDKFLFYNNLVTVVKGLEGQYTTIDLRDETYLTGRIKYVDGSMNVDLDDVILYDSRGTERPFESFFVNARLIRYVHIPKHQSAVDIAQNHIENLAKPKAKAKAPRTFKSSRAEKYQKETIRSINSKNEEENLTSDVAK